MKKKLSLIPFIALLFSLFVIGKSTVAADETTYEIEYKCLSLIF